MTGLRPLERLGWVEIDDIQDNSALMLLAESLGRVAGDQGIETLYATTKAQATNRSFSFHHGLGQFPMHSDTAFWPLPARYVVLRSERPCKTPTLLLPFPELQNLLNASRAETAIFSIRTTAGSSYGRAQFSRAPFGIRFDPCYMKGANSNARMLTDRLSFPSPKVVERFTWTGTNALVIDNWKCLHARASVPEGDLERAVSRIYVAETKR